MNTDPRTHALIVRRQEREVLEWATRLRDDFASESLDEEVVELIANQIDRLEDLESHDTTVTREARHLYWAADVLRNWAARAGSREWNEELGRLADEVERVAETHTKGNP